MKWNSVLVIDQFKSFWCSLDSNMQAAIVQAIVTVGTASLAAIGILWQIGRQAKQGRDEIRHNEELKIKQSVYQEFVDVCRDSESAYSKVSSYVRDFESRLFYAKIMSEQGILEAPKHRYTELSELHFAYTKKTIRIMGVQERWAIIDPRTDVFRIGISAALRDLAEIQQVYFDLAMRVMPFVNKDGQLLPWKLPTKKMHQELKEVGAEYLEKLLNVSCYVFDTLVEMQNLLLGDVFDNVVSLREPPDPKQIVLSLKNRDELMQYFEQVTSSGEAKNTS